SCTSSLSLPDALPIFLVLPRLDEELEVAVLPTHATPARPDAQRAVLEKVLVPYSREAQIGLGALAHAESAGEQAHRVFVDFGRRSEEHTSELQSRSEL